MIVAQVFLEAMEGCHLFLSPFFVMQTRVFRVNPSTIVQIFVSPGCKDGLPLIWLPRPPSPSEPPSRLRRHLPLYSPPATPKILPHRVHPPPPPHQPRPRFLALSTTRDHLPNSAASSTFQTWVKSSPRFPPRQASNTLRSQRFHTASSRPLQPQHPRVASPPDRISWPSHLRILRIRLARGVFFPIPSLVLIQEPRIRQSAAQHRPVLPRPEPCALSEPRAAPACTTRSPHPPTVSPLQIALSRSGKSQLVVDLSFPRGTSVNDAIPKDSYLDSPLSLRLPGIDALVNITIQKGTGCLLFKKELRHAYRQLRFDPRDYHLLAFGADSGT